MQSWILNCIWWVQQLPSLLGHCWLGVRKSIEPAKMSDGVLSWLSVRSEVHRFRIIWPSWCHFHPIISCFIKIRNDFTFLMPAYPGCPGKDAMRRMSNLPALYVKYRQQYRICQLQLQLLCNRFILGFRRVVCNVSCRSLSDEGRYKEVRVSSVLGSRKNLVSRRKYYTLCLSYLPVLI